MRPLAMLALVTCGVALGGAAAAIDFTGNWLVGIHYTNPFDVTEQESWSVQQTGTQLTVSVDGGSPHGGFIDPMTGDFGVTLATGESFPFQCADTTASGTVAADGQTFTGTIVGYLEQVTYPFGCLQLSGDLGGIRPLCGNGRIDPGEECDDGNTMDGDCCSSKCRLDPAGFGCGGTGVCGAMSCDGAGTCTDMPATVCGTTCFPGTCVGGSCVQSPAPAGTACSEDRDVCTVEACDGGGNCVIQSNVTCGMCEGCDAVAGCIGRPQSGCSAFPVHQLRLRTGGPTQHKLSFLARDPALETYFPDPVNGTYDLLACVFDVTPGRPAGVLSKAFLLPGGTCRGKPCWSAIRDGYRFRDPDQTQYGVSEMTLRTSAARGASMQAKGGGPNLTLPASFTGVTNVLIQLNDVSCLEARYDEIEIRDGGRRLTGK